MQKYLKYIRDIIFILFFIRLTYIENNQLYLLFQTIGSLVYLFIPNDIQPKTSNTTDIIE
jgi:hypothetical protein